ncbi:MAG: UDP-2,3-diacylglucosamine diphosphatase [Prevotellaceae bacterium]|jgi:UDP-2,3-diacylglucosamine hydrolase|nr:UDP-2,3-diacylglucosamine diphosphatase [Prevotellaceae bacterium]
MEYQEEYNGSSCPTKIYFAADVHLGLGAGTNATERENAFVNWLDKIKTDAEIIFLLGDIFDFWFEYKYVVPRGFTRVLGKLAELTDSGIVVHFFTGNHDMWTFDYLENETGIKVHKKPYVTTLYGKKFFVAHGDGLGKDSKGYIFLKYIFSCKLIQWIFAFLHPRIGIGIAKAWSKRSRLNRGLSENFNENNDRLLAFAKQKLNETHIDFFVFGHRHTPIQIQLQDDSLFTIVGEWIRGREYAVFDKKELTMHKHKF